MRNLVTVLTGLIIGISAHGAHGQQQTFPYEAIVVKDDVLVRSGGNDEFYPTQKLQRDTVVTVKRHDTGGWYMIAPPQGSFNWIPARYVDRTSADSGTINEDHVIAFVGSEFGDEISVWQGRLSADTPVTILEQRDVDTRNGPQSMYRIAPPVRDRRWIRGDTVVPADQEQRKQLDSDPFETPSAIRERPAPVLQDAQAALESQPQQLTPRPSARLQRIRTIRKEQRRLAEIDQRFRNMIRQNPATWDLRSLEDEYTELRDTATWRPVAGQIDLRFPAIDRYLRRQADYEDFQRLTSETERRDAELLAGIKNSDTAELPQPMTGRTLPPFDVAAVSPQGQLDVAAPPIQPSDSNEQIDSPVADSIPFPDPPGGINPASRYVGAGIVQKSDEGTFFLATPSGRRLAQLKGSESVQLQEFVGKQVGLHGQRWFREDIGSDFIEVTGLEPVQIKR